MFTQCFDTEPVSQFILFILNSMIYDISPFQYYLEQIGWWIVSTLGRRDSLHLELHGITLLILFSKSSMLYQTRPVKSTASSIVFEILLLL